MHQAGPAGIAEASDGKLSISINLKRRSGRRLITVPDSSVQEPRPWDTEPTSLQLALAQGHRLLQCLSQEKQGRSKVPFCRHIVTTTGILERRLLALILKKG